MPITTHTYGNEEITVLWEPAKCIHSAICFKGLPQVFDPRRRPWIEIENATAEMIKNQVAQCPSGAISILKDNQAAP